MSTFLAYTDGCLVGVVIASTRDEAWSLIQKHRRRAPWDVVNRSGEQLRIARSPLGSYERYLPTLKEARA